MKTKGLIFTFIFSLALFSAHSADDATKINWDLLKDVSYKKKWNAELSMYFLYPTFGPNLKRLEGREVLLRGYMIPVDATSNLFMLSAFPFSMCFFCGGAGPESVVDLKFKDKPKRFKTDEIHTIRGKLVLNDNNVEEMTYILKEAELAD
jgi:hypothetical protein